jgi:pimeloyl-ACP methyl ester carboxylesterase
MILKKYCNYLLFFLAGIGVICLDSCMQMRTADKKMVRKFDAKTYKPRFDTYQVANKKIHYIAVDSPTILAKATLIFIHGAPGSSDAFISYLTDDSLVARYTMVSVDRSGYGYSNFGCAETDIEKQAALLRPVLQKYRTRQQPIIIVAHSFGCAVASRLAIDYPNLVDGLLFMGPAIDPQNEKIFWMSYPINVPPIRWLVPRVWRVTNDEKLSHVAELQKIIPLWYKIHQPVTVIQGGKDWIVPPVNANFAQQMLINAQPLTILRYPNWDHFIPFTQKITVVKTIDDLVEKIVDSN